MQQDQVTPAIDRVFRTYVQYCTAFNEDSIFQLLTALHSLDDRLNPAHGRVMFKIPEYIALKALRNHFHHGAEVRNTVRFKSLAGTGVSSDLGQVCLISFADAIAAIDGTEKKYRIQAADAIAATFKDWGTVVDINPCVFNCVVKVFETTQALKIPGASEEYAKFKNQYDWESHHGHAHYVTGAVSLHAADVSRYAEMMASLYRS
ncbi:MAG: hypothetical protein ACXWU9_11855 [Telluria sp.]